MTALLKIFGHLDTFQTGFANRRTVTAKAGGRGMGEPDPRPPTRRLSADFGR